MFKKENIIIWLICLFILGAVIGYPGYIVYRTFFQVHRSFHPIPFDQQRWLQADPEERGRMVMDLFPGKTRQDREVLTEQSPLYGMTKDEVRAFLGPPDVEREKRWEWNIGYLDINPHRIGISQFGLLVFFDEDNVVSSVIIVM